MNRIISFVSRLFSYSYNESKGFLALIVVSVISLFFIFFPKMFVRDQMVTDPEEIIYLDSLEGLFKVPERQMFHFDPNSCSVDSLVLLGFPQNVAQRLVNYREKGGRFRIKDDVQKVYGVNEELMNTLRYFIDLPASSDAASRALTPVDINMATIEQLKEINMIGDVLANRIIKYRKLLGGFINMDQLLEVYGLTEPAIANLTSLTFVVTDFKPRQIKVNHADVIELMKHPYISNQLAEDMIRYKEINSSIATEKVLINFKSIDKSSFEKLILYLDFQ